jgi:hypothetical protein
MQKTFVIFHEIVDHININSSAHTFQSRTTLHTPCRTYSTTPRPLYVTALGEQMCSYHQSNIHMCPPWHVFSAYSKNVILQEVTSTRSISIVHLAIHPRNKHKTSLQSCYWNHTNLSALFQYTATSKLEMLRSQNRHSLMKLF